MSAFELTGIRKRLGGFSLEVEELEFEQGRTYAIVGPNGSGKTTLLSILGLIERADAGSIKLDGEAVDVSNAESLSSARRKVAYLMQNPYLFHMSVRHNIELGMKLRGVDEATRVARSGGVMEQLRLSGLASRPLRTLSGGEAQRVAIARTIAMDSKVFLLDEPVAGVDRENVRTVEDIIRKLSTEQGATVIISTHSQNQAVRLSENIITVVDGQIADIEHENIFAGKLIEAEDDVKLVSVCDDVNFMVSHGEPGPVTIALDPSDIILSKQMIESSALNELKGRVTKIEEARDSLQVYIDVGVPLCTRITRKSVKDLSIEVGCEMWVTFKATAVKVL